MIYSQKDYIYASMHRALLEIKYSEIRSWKVPFNDAWSLLLVVG